MGGLQATSSSSMSCSCFFLKTIFVAIITRIKPYKALNKVRGAISMDCTISHTCDPAVCSRRGPAAPGLRAPGPPPPARARVASLVCRDADSDTVPVVTRVNVSSPFSHSKNIRGQAVTTQHYAENQLGAVRFEGASRLRTRARMRSARAPPGPRGTTAGT